MKGKTRNIYSGGNTPTGFYSYYTYILPQRKAEKFFCIKGGPGVGKSTLMKAVAKHFAEKGECVDLLWCSSDPDSLDGVLLKERAVALVDGTSPHVIDPQNPGAVDEIINLGTFWDEEGLRKNREKIITCGEETGAAFACAYGYLQCASAQYKFMEQVMGKVFPEQRILELRRQLFDAVDVVESGSRTGSRSKFFASAITPAGLKNEIRSIVSDAETVIVIDAPAGFRTEKLLAPLSDRLTEAGFDVEEYYCPMDPEKKLEHVYCPAAKVAAVTNNDYHEAGQGHAGKHTVKIDVGKKAVDCASYHCLLEDLKKTSRENISKALDYLKKARQYHNMLEQYYIPNMDFSEMERVKEEIIEKIEGNDK